MQFEEVINLRRSVRKYRESEITEGEIREMIAFSLNAPSWKNSETGRYYVALSKEKREEVIQALSDRNREKSMNACAFVVTAFLKGVSGFTADGERENEVGEEWGAYDLGLQNQLLMLKASEMGYDTLIMGLRDGEALRRIFSIPDSECVMAVISIGKREAEPPKAPRKSTEDVSVIL